LAAMLVAILVASPLPACMAGSGLPVHSLAQWSAFAHGQGQVSHEPRRHYFLAARGRVHRT